MRHASRIFTIFAMLLMVVCSPSAYADKMDDLDVTMEVVDDASDIDAAISRMRGPDDDVGDERYWEYENAESFDGVDGEGSGETFDDNQVDFEMTDEFEEDREFEEDAVHDEDDFEDGEDVDGDFVDDYEEPDQPDDDESEDD